MTATPAQLKKLHQRTTTAYAKAAALTVQRDAMVAELHEQGMTRPELARVMGVTRAVVHRIVGRSA